MSLLTKGTPLKLIYHYDLLCLHSYYGYQIIKQKLPQWLSKNSNITVDFIPVIGPKLFRCAHGHLFDGICAQKREYIVKELYLIAELYNLQKPKKIEWNSDLLLRRSVSALLFLTHLKRDVPTLYEPFLQEFWQNIWIEDFYITKVARIFKVGREMGIEFRVMDDLISKIEEPQNVKTLLSVTNSLTLTDALGTPWIEFGTDENRFVFNEITRLEKIQHLIDHPEHLPPLREFPEIRKLKYAAPQSTFIEDYSS
uniref:Thioredoxin-like fold domain-containing protein n=1 Tax=Panagrolaimus sp. PS1159 TaxID=55785 RepID=A0AC35F2C3_9BILA